MGMVYVFGVFEGATQVGKDSLYQHGTPGTPYYGLTHEQVYREVRSRWPSYLIVLLLKQYQGTIKSMEDTEVN